MECWNRSKPPSFKRYGLGLPGCDFFAPEGPLEAVVDTPPVLNAVVITMHNNMASVEMISEDLCEWGLEDWDWHL